MLNYRQKHGTGYKNLISHLRQHPVYRDAALAAIELKGGGKSAKSFFIDKGASTTLRWLEFIITTNLPLSFVDDEMMRKSAKFDQPSYHTFVKRFNRVVELVERQVAAELKDKRFALVFNGFTEGAEHCLGAFAAHEDGMRFLAFSPFDDESSMTADEHIEFLDSLIDDFGMDAANLVCIVSDNMATNHAISKMWVAHPTIGIVVFLEIVVE